MLIREAPGRRVLRIAVRVEDVLVNPAGDLPSEAVLGAKEVPVPAATPGWAEEGWGEVLNGEVEFLRVCCTQGVVFTPLVLQDGLEGPQEGLLDLVGQIVWAGHHEAHSGHYRRRIGLRLPAGEELQLEGETEAPDANVDRHEAKASR